VQSRPIRIITDDSPSISIFLDNESVDCSNQASGFRLLGAKFVNLQLMGHCDAGAPELLVGDEISYSIDVGGFSDVVFVWKVIVHESGIVDGRRNAKGDSTTKNVEILGCDGVA
jgi:hypothetical protein